MTNWTDRPKTHRRRVGKGSHALKLRREGALYRLEQVKEPNKQQAIEIDILQHRLHRG